MENASAWTASADLDRDMLPVRCPLPQSTRRSSLSQWDWEICLRFRHGPEI